MGNVKDYEIFKIDKIRVCGEGFCVRIMRFFMLKLGFVKEKIG